LDGGELELPLDEPAATSNSSPGGITGGGSSEPKNKSPPVLLRHPCLASPHCRSVLLDVAALCLLVPVPTSSPAAWRHDSRSGGPTGGPPLPSAPSNPPPPLPSVGWIPRRVGGAATQVAEEPRGEGLPACCAR
jgi:hypothetical protein